MKNTPFTYENYIKSKDEYVYGRISSYSETRGYGFIYTEYGTDLFVSSYNFINSSTEKRVVIGAIVKFKVKLKKEDNTYYADKVIIVEKFPNGKILYLPNDKQINYKDITNFFVFYGKILVSKFNLLDKLPKDYDINKLICVCINIKKSDPIKFFNIDSPIEGDGKCDIDLLIKDLKEKILYL